MNSVKTRPRVPSQLLLRLMDISGLNPWDGNDSSSRKQMFGSQMSQLLVVKGATERYHQTGMEREFGKYTFSIKMPVNGEVIKVIDRYRSKIGDNAIAFSPQSIIIYENSDTKEIGIINVGRYCSNHQYFGFDYKPSKFLQLLTPGMSIPAGTVLFDSPSVTPDGGYKYGVECNVAFMTVPGASEDGIVISRDALPKFAFNTYETRVVEWGSECFPLNLYGDDDTYKPFPDIGDYIRDDGVLVALRTYDTDLAIVEQNTHSLRNVDHIYDKSVYAGGPGGQVVDIRIHHDKQNTRSGTPRGMETQPDKYDVARREFHREILKEYNRLRTDRHDNLSITPEFSSLVVDSISALSDEKERVTKLYRSAQLDDWRVEIVVKYTITPTTGFKLTDTHGGKGVICTIMEPECMPVDAQGRRADLIFDPNSTLSRMNIGRLHEQYINSASYNLIGKIRAAFDMEKGEKKLVDKIEQLERANRELVDRIWAYLLGYYDIVSPKMAMWFRDNEYRQPRSVHLASIIENDIYLYMPPDNDPEPDYIVKQIEQFYTPVYGPVTYTGNSGVQVTTKMPVRIGSMYIILLEKTADDWTSISSAKLQQSGVIAQVTNADKYSTPNRGQSIRAHGESEVRNDAAYCDPSTAADLIDRNNNPAAHKEILHSILTADKPTNIQIAVDRERTPIGGSKPNGYVGHLAACGGWGFAHKKHLPTRRPGSF